MSTFRSKNYFNFQYSKSLSIIRRSFGLKSSKILPKYCKNIVLFPFTNHEIKVFLINDLIQKLINTLIH